MSEVRNRQYDTTTGLQQPTFKNGQIIKKENQETLDLNYTLHQINLTDIYGTFHPRALKHTLFLGTYGTFFRMDQYVGHETNV